MIKFIIVTTKAILLLSFFIFVILIKTIYAGVKKSDIEDMFADTLNIFDLNTFDFREKLRLEQK